MIMGTLFIVFGFLAQESVVTLPLDDYLELKKTAEQLEHDKSLKPDVTLVSSEASIRFHQSFAEMTTRFTVQVTGKLDEVALSLTGLPISAQAGADPVSVQYRDGKLWFTPLQAGRHLIEVKSVAPLTSTRGSMSMQLAPFEASVNRLNLILGSQWDWRFPNAALVREYTSEQGPAVELAPPLGVASKLHLVPKHDQQQQLRAESAIVTVMDVGRDTTRFIHSVFYKVYSGSLTEQSLSGLDPSSLDQVWTSDSTVSKEEIYRSNVFEIQGRKRIVNPTWRGDRAFIPLIRVLDDTGYAVWKTRAQDGTSFSLPALDPGIPIRAQYFVLASSRVVEAQLPETDGWQRVDVTDLPDQFAEMAHSEGLSALSVWRTAEPRPANPMVIKRFPDVAELETVIADRVTTTLVTIEGRLVHRDALQLLRNSSILELTLSPGSSLWSTIVDGVAVRPLVQGNLVKIPLTPNRRGTCEVELVSVAEHDLPSSRTTLALTLPAWNAPVLKQEWKVVLPEHRRYRFKHSDLDPIPLTQYVSSQRVSVSVRHHSGGGTIEGQITDGYGNALPGVKVSLDRDPSTQVVSGIDGRFKMVNLKPGTYSVVASIPGFNTQKTTVRVRSQTTHTIRFNLSPAAVEEIHTVVTSEESRRTRPEEDMEARVAQNSYLAQQVIQDDIYSNLQAGLVGGVKPIPVAIPENGKLMVFSGALPPASIRLELDVKK